MLTFEQWPIDRLIEYARNPRKNDHAVDQMAAAIQEFGFRIPCVAQSDLSLIHIYCTILSLHRSQTLLVRLSFATPHLRI